MPEEQPTATAHVTDVTPDVAKDAIDRNEAGKKMNRVNWGRMLKTGALVSRRSQVSCSVTLVTPMIDSNIERKAGRL